MIPWHHMVPQPQGLEVATECHCMKTKINKKEGVEKMGEKKKGKKERREGRKGRREKKEEKKG